MEVRDLVRVANNIIDFQKKRMDISVSIMEKQIAINNLNIINKRLLYSSKFIPSILELYNHVQRVITELENDTQKRS